MYRRVIVSRRGGPNVLHVISDKIPEPGIKEVRIKILAAGISFADILMREGVYPSQPKFPFTPGYDIYGIVDKLGKEATSVELGQPVLALTKVGGYSEYICLPEKELIQAPLTLDPAEAVSLVLNYVTAYQMLHRVARVKKGDRVLIHSAAGGVGTALMQLGKLLNLEMYGTASIAKHNIVADLGGYPIDYKKKNFVKEIMFRTKDGVDAVFDGIGGPHLFQSYKTLRNGGKLVAYGVSSLLVNGHRVWLKNISTYVSFLGALLMNYFPDGKRVMLYQIPKLRKQNPDWFRNDLTTLLQLLKEKKIKPIIAERIPLTEAARAHEELNKASIIGKIVLICNQ
ncbi:MAG: medium chain dehydrogenase/reductase family protein [Ignavibacteriaceae bacterium]